MDLQQTPVHAVRFSGTVNAFFRIWIVNLTLSILTLGIYSAWAKVRTNRYFYSNTDIDGHCFRYLAQPLQILIGRLIAATLFIGYVVIANIVPAAMPVFLLIFFFVAPWLINQSVRFGLRMTSYRNIRFNFSGTYLPALLYFGVLPIVAVVTLGLAYPWVLKKMDEYIHANISYASQVLTPRLRTSEYYWTIIVVVAAVVFISLIYFAISLLVMPSLAAHSSAEASVNASTVFFMLISLSWYLILFATVRAVYRARIRNHLFNTSGFSDIARFRSSLPIAGYAFLLATNALAIIATLGLAYPWAKIRQARFLAYFTSVYLASHLASLVDEYGQSESALAEEAAGFFDVEVGIG